MIRRLSVCKSDVDTLDFREWRFHYLGRNEVNGTAPPMIRTQKAKGTSLLPSLESEEVVRAIITEIPRDRTPGRDSGSSGTFIP
jgi:hypothetical protein